jgi:hypothetical protein
LEANTSWQDALYTTISSHWGGVRKTLENDPLIALRGGYRIVRQTNPGKRERGEVGQT